MTIWSYNLTVDGHTLIFQVATPNPSNTATVTAISISGSVDGHPITGLEQPGGYGGNDNQFSTSAGYFFDGVDDMGMSFDYNDPTNGMVQVNLYNDDDQLWVGSNNSSQTISYVDAATVNSYSEVACFATGTRIQTPAGPVTVEDLAVGDRLLTAEGRAAPVIWIGHRTVNCAAHPCPNDVMPVRVRRGAFAEGVPSRDLWLSPDHAIHAETCLIPVKHLLNGATIVQEQADSITYWHVELHRHDVILAEGLPCESYLDNGGRAAFATGGRVIELHPDFTPAERCEATGEAAACAPQRIAGPEFTAVDEALRARATALGYAVAAGFRAAMPAALSPDLADLLQADWYLAQNPDVAAAGMDAALHYAAHGRREGRLPCPEAPLIGGLGLIDPATVMRTMPDVVVAGEDLAAHYCRYGWREQRRPNAYVDPAFYGQTYDVPDGMNPLLHYVLFGEHQGLAPSRHFDPAWYRQHYGLAPSVCALAHYLRHRRTQHFSPLPSFDATAYAAAHQGALQPGRDAYMHFLVSEPAAPWADRRRAA
jgi:hypothetical protein